MMFTISQPNKKFHLYCQQTTNSADTVTRDEACFVIILFDIDGLLALRLQMIFRKQLQLQLQEQLLLIS